MSSVTYSGPVHAKLGETSRAFFFLFAESRPLEVQVAGYFIMGAVLLGVARLGIRVWPPYRREPAKLLRVVHRSVAIGVLLATLVVGLLFVADTIAAHGPDRPPRLSDAYERARAMGMLSLRGASFAASLGFLGLYVGPSLAVNEWLDLARSERPTAFTTQGPWIATAALLGWELYRCSGPYERCLHNDYIGEWQRENLIVAGRAMVAPLWCFVPLVLGIVWRTARPLAIAPTGNRAGALLGLGIAAFVVTRPFAADADAPLRYLPWAYEHMHQAIVVEVDANGGFAGSLGRGTTRLPRELDVGHRRFPHTNELVVGVARVRRRWSMIYGNTRGHNRIIFRVAPGAPEAAIVDYRDAIAQVFSMQWSIVDVVPEPHLSATLGMLPRTRDVWRRAPASPD